MHKELAFEVDILSERLCEDTEWRFVGRNFATLQICSKKSVADNLYDLSGRAEFVRHIALRLWIPKILGGPANRSERPSVTGAAKSIKEHINRLVVALMQAPYLKSVDVQIQLHRISWESTLSPAVVLDPVVLDESEIKDLVSWYTQPFRLLRGINIDFRYLGGMSV